MWIVLEATELMLAFIGCIWTFQLIASIAAGNNHDICHEGYFIGIVDYAGTATISNTIGTGSTKKKVDFVINLYMKELKNGRTTRDFIIMGQDDWHEIFLDKSKTGQELLAWKKGGKFPEDFKPIEPLGEMLNRMIKAKFSGKEITVNVEKPDA